MRVTILFGASVNSVSQTTKIMDIKKGWLRENPLFGPYELLNYTADLDIITWQTGNHGINMSYIYSEIDGESSGSRNFSTTFEYEDPDDPGSTITANASATIPFNTSDADLGADIVEYCDDTDGEGHEYKTGRVLFKVRQ